MLDKCEICGRNVRMSNVLDNMIPLTMCMIIMSVVAGILEYTKLAILFVVIPYAVVTLVLIHMIDQYF